MNRGEKEKVLNEKLVEIVRLSYRLPEYERDEGNGDDQQIQ